MPIPDSAFQFVPHLRRKVIQPEDSRMRLSVDDIEIFDRNASKQGRPKPWRLSDEERELTRKRTLSGHENQDLWILAYGSLIWDPCVNTTELRRARIYGYSRHFCLNQPYGRGSPEHPGLMLALDLAGLDEFCDAITFRVPADLVEVETVYVWRREMLTGSYVPKLLKTETPQGEVESLAFVVNRENPRYVDLSACDAARRIAAASGPAGTNIAYLENLVQDLKLAGIHDQGMCQLLNLAHGILDKPHAT